LLKGQPQKALAEFQRASELDPQMAAAFFELGRLQVVLSSQNVGSQARDHDILDPGIIALTRAFELEPGNGDYAGWLGRAHHHKGDLERALEYLKKAVELDPQNATALKRMGIIYLEEGQAQQARTSFEGAIAADPRDAGAYFQLGQTLQLLQDPAGARRAYEQAIAADRTRPEPYSSLAKLLAQAGEQEASAQAEADFKRWETFDQELKRRMMAVNQNPSDARALLALGEMYFAVQKWPEALEWFLKSLNIDPKDAHTHLYCGIVRRELEEYEAATNHLKEAEFLAPDSLDPKLELVRLYGATQDEKSLEELLTRIEIEAAQDPEALRAVADVCAEVGFAAQAERLRQRASDVWSAPVEEGR
jgi:tetratricopeptide (TPR) repeat protein